jgi:hypothetical protein
MKCPPLSRFIIYADDAKLAAQVSCALAVPKTYLPICDGPRLQRPDGNAEAIRRTNAAARAKSKIAVMVALSDQSANAMKHHLKLPCISISGNDDIRELPAVKRKRSNTPLVWGRDRIGVGLLKALRAGSSIEFEDRPSPIDTLPAKGEHLVICEDGEELSQIIAANYAFALNAGLCLIPSVDRDIATSLLEHFYRMYDPDSVQSPAQARAYLIEELLNLSGPLKIPNGSSITFIGKLPFGFAYNSYPSTHLFDYPDLGISIVNGFTAEQPHTHGTGAVVLVDPGTTPAPEIQSSIDLLSPRRAFIRVYQGRAANVRHVSEMIEHFPYDLLIVATHCGDSSGYRCTYEFTDSEGLPRTLVVDVAVGFAGTDDPNIVSVSEFMRFVSLDGVDWNDPKEKAELYIGTAIRDFMTLAQSGPNELKPVKRESVSRVVGSSAMMMSDGNYIVMPRSLADETTPVIINNACLSWHRLAETFTFANARAYVGTLFPITPTEASEIVVKILDKHWHKPLASALWSSQREVYGADNRRPYVTTGVYPQHLRVKQIDYPKKIKSQLTRSLARWEEALASIDRSDSKRVRRYEEIVKIYQKEIRHFRKHGA